MTTKKVTHKHTSTESGKCPTCGRSLADRKPAVPLPPDTRLDRATTSAIKALNQIKAEQGASAAKAAMAKLTAAIRRTQAVETA